MAEEATMFDSRSDHPRCRIPGFPASQHMRRYNDTWRVAGVETVHPAKPVLPKAEDIAESLDLRLDLIDLASIAQDGITGLPPFPARMTCTWVHTWDEDYGYYDCCHECACGCDAYYADYDALLLVEAIFPSVMAERSRVDLTPKVPGAVASVESDGYVVKIAARIEPSVPAKVYRKRDLDPYTGEPIRSIRPGGFISATSRKTRR